MFKKSMPLVFVALAGCITVALPEPNKDSTQPSSKPSESNQAGSQTPSPAPSASPSASATPTKSPTFTPTPVPTPTPTPTPLPNNVLKVDFRSVAGMSNTIPGLKVLVENLMGKNKILIRNFDYYGIALSQSGDVYIQAGIPTASIPLNCPTCDTNLNPDGILDYAHSAIFKQRNNEDEFEFVAMGQKETDSSGKTRYAPYSQWDFTFSKFTEITGEPTASWVVNSVDTTKKEINFDSTVWPKNPGPLKVGDVGDGDFFGQDAGRSSSGEELSLVRKRTAFTGTAAYFIGRGTDTRFKGDFSELQQKKENTTIFRVNETGAREIVGKKIAEKLAGYTQYGFVTSFVYSQKKQAFYLLVENGSSTNSMHLLYRISEDALVP